MPRAARVGTFPFLFAEFLYTAAMTYGALPSTELIAEGKYEEAVAKATAEMAAMPGEPEARFNRGQALAALGRLDEAVADYEATLAMDASASALDPAVVDDELFFALRSMAQARDRAQGLALLERYRQVLPDGRHVADIAKWADHLNGVEVVWYRDRA
jgi:tetratricopeptide (TPR) repeat protein